MKRRNERIALLAVSALALGVTTLSSGPVAALPFTIRWTAPGDDSLTGRATTYDLRYSKSPITAANFALATRVTGVPAPLTAGSTETYSVTGLTDGVVYYLAIKAGDEVGHWSVMSNVLKRPGITVGVAELAPTLFFSGPRPNPARDLARWSYSMVLASHALVQVYDAAGRHVRTLVDSDQPAGPGELAWDLHDSDGRAVAAGIYFVRARLGAAQWTRRLLIVR